MFTTNIILLAPLSLHPNQRLSSYAFQPWQHNSSLSHLA